MLYPFKQTNDVTGDNNSVMSISDTTASTALQLATHRQLSNIRETASAIETVYNELPQDYKKLVHLRYWSKRNLKWDLIANECHVSVRQALRWRDSIVLATSELLGLR